MPNLQRIVWSALALSLATTHAARADEPASPRYAYFGAGLGYVHLADNLTYTDDGDLQKGSVSSLVASFEASLGYRVAPRLVLGGTFDFIIAPSSTLNMNVSTMDGRDGYSSSGTGIGGVIGPKLVYRLAPRSHFDGALGFAAFGKSDVYGGTGVALRLGVSFDQRANSGIRVGLTVMHLGDNTGGTSESDTVFLLELDGYFARSRLTDG